MHWFDTIKQQDNLYDFLYQMPKGGDLHNHLSCSGHAEWWYESARKFGYLQHLSDVERQVWIDKAPRKRQIFHLLKKPHVLAEIMYRNMKSFSEEGVKYVEFQIPHPRLIPVLRTRLNQQDAVDTGVIVRFQGCVRRGHARKTIVRTDIGIQLNRIQHHIHENSDVCVGINLIDHEYEIFGYSPKIRSVYETIEVPLSIHAGETTNPNSHVKDALEIGASRIGHALNLIHDSKTMQRMKDDLILIETSLLSNKHFGHITDYKQHPFPIYLRSGIPITLCTDDRGLWGSTLTDEFYAAVTSFDLSWEEVKKISRNSLEYSFADDTTKEKLLDSYDSRISQFSSTQAPTFVGACSQASS